ncbi:MAG: hypothetical protein RID91_15545 [Azospirillaceae bacterium]
MKIELDTRQLLGFRLYESAIGAKVGGKEGSKGGESISGKMGGKGEPTVGVKNEDVDILVGDKIGLKRGDKNDPVVR